MKRSDWYDLARQVDWQLSYVTEEEAFPVEVSGRPWLPGAEWASWDEPFRTTFTEYVHTQAQKEESLRAVEGAVGSLDDVKRLPASWRSVLKLHAATLPLAEFAAVVGNLRAARFGRTSAWRQTAVLGALDEVRHAQLPLRFMHKLVPWDAQFDWTHRFYHSNNWVAIAARHFFDELLLVSDPIEFAVATNFVFETGFTNLQFVALTALAHATGDRMFEKMLASIQSDEARHAQMGGPELAKLVAHDRARAQFLVDKWFWRSWRLFAVVTGFSMDYLTPVEARTRSFKEFMNEWIVGQFATSLAAHGLELPWYWPRFLESLDWYHHMVYASAYTYRASVWFDLALPGPDERAWLRAHYPASWPALDPVWERVTESWRQADAGNEFAVHGSAIIGFCELCQLVLSAGTPARNDAVVVERGADKRIFCSEECRWLFEREPERYAAHRGVVKRVLAGEAPPNLLAMLRGYFGLTFDDWGKDLEGGRSPFIDRPPR